MGKSGNKKIIICPQCDTPTVADVDRPGCRYCPACQEPVIYNAEQDVVIVTRHPEPEDARYRGVDDAIKAALGPISRLIGPHLKVIRGEPEDVVA